MAREFDPLIPTRPVDPVPDLPGDELLLSLHEPVLVVDAGFVVRRANPAFLLEFGLSDDDVLGRPLYHIQHGIWGSAEVRELLERIVPGRDLVEDHPLALPGQGPDGAGYRLNARPIRTGRNELRYIILAFRRAAPVTPPERSGTGDSLRQLAIEHTADVLALYDGEGRCLYLGATGDHVLGYDRREWLRMSVCDLIHPDDREGFVTRVRGGTTAAAVTQVVARVRRAGGDQAWIEVTIRRVAHATEGELFHATLRDVTQRRRAEDTLRWLSRQTKLILDTAAEGIFGVDTHGVITFANPAAGSILRRKADALIGNQCDFVLVPEEGGEHAITATLRDGLVRTVRRADFRAHGGGTVVVEFTCNPARQHGKVVGAVVTFRDVSERLRAEANIRKSEWLAAVGQTVQAFRHEINNPLSALLAGVQLLEMGGNSPEEESEMVASVAAHARRIRDAVRQLTIAPPTQD